MGKMNNYKIEEIDLALIEYRRDMEIWSRKFFRVREDADDLVQNTCLKALEHAGRFHGGSVRDWLFVIMRNTAVDMSERIYNRGAETDAETLALSVEMHLERLDVDMALDALTEELRTALTLYAEGYTTKQIAEIVGCREGTVSSRIHTARVRLRKMVS